VQPDLVSLEITKGELRRLTGFKADQVFRSSMMANREQRLGFFRSEMLLSLVLTLIIVGFIYALIILPTIGSSPILLIIGFVIVFIGVIAGRWLWRSLIFPKSLVRLLDEVDKYHAVIKAIDTNDQLVSDETSQSILNDRSQAIAALQLLKEDLVQALKIERSVRTPKQLPANHQDLFVNHLSNQQSLQLSDHSSQYTPLFNQILEIGLAVEAQIRKLQRL